MSPQEKSLKRKHSISIRSKFLLMLLSISIFSIAIIGFQGLYNGHNSLTNGIKQQLSILRTSRAQQLENYFQNRRNQISTLANSTMIISAMDEFSSAFSLLESYDIKLEDDKVSKLENYYEKEFFPELREGSDKTQPYDVDNYLPHSLVGKYLQYHYIANNTNKLGEKDLFNSADDNSYYSKVHQKYHPKLQKFTKTFDYYDIFLIDKDTKDIIYSAFKETDFATSLNRDIQAQSNLAHLVDKVIESPTKGEVHVIDIKPYISSYNKPASFLATPIYEENKFIGVLALQISINQITSIMDANKTWRESGLGETGEVYLVGADQTMRSNSRFLSEKKIDYIKTLHRVGFDEALVTKIALSNRTVLLQPIDTIASRAALRGETDIKTIVGYKKQDVLSAYQPVKIPGLEWAVLAEIDESEVTKPIISFQKKLLISAAIQAALISFFSLWLAGRFIQPIKTLIQGAKRANEGDTKTRIEMNRRDEFGELTNSFNDMIGNIQNQKDTINAKEKTVNKLLLNSFPPDIAKRYMNGESNIASRIRYTADLGGMRISQSVYNQLTDTSDFKKCDLMTMRGVGDIATWEYSYKSASQKKPNELTQQD